MSALGTAGLLLAVGAGIIAAGIAIARLVGGPGCRGCGMTYGQCEEAKAHGYRACCPDCDHRPE